jgi:hypothetical protein
VVIDVARQPKVQRQLPDNAPRAVLLEWIREWSPDLLIRRQTLDDGRRACGARFSFRGESLEVEAIQDGELLDPDDAIVRRVAWMLWRRMGLHPALSLADRRRREQDIMSAAMAGATDRADEMAAELTAANDGRVTRAPLIATQFESFGTSMFGRR